MSIEARFYRIVVDALARDRLVLPTLPEVALCIHELLQRDDVTSNQLAAEVQRDPAIAVRLIRVANSAAMRSGRSVESIQQAVTRLGLQYTRLLVNGLALEQMFSAGNDMLKDRLARCWRDSVDVAALARALAAQCTLLPPEMAMLAGLIHRVGELPILKMAEQHQSAIDTPQALDEVVERLAPRIGRMVLQAWSFPADLVDVPVLWRDCARDHPGAADHADVVAVAVARLRLERQPEPIPPPMPAHTKLDLEPCFDLGGAGPLADVYQSSLRMLQAA
ncbi:MAG: HDOD domain-containing protein [Gammaproteobacteria bacterium]